MQTRQDKIVGRIGPVIIRAGGWFVSPDKASKLLQTDRLLEFLNIDVKNSKEVNDFCAKYAFIPRDLSKGWESAIAVEQKIIKDIIHKFQTNTLSEAEIKVINEQIKEVVKGVRLISKSDLIRIQNEIKALNGNNDYYEILSTNGKEKYLIEVKEHNSSQASLWDELLSFLRTNKPLKQCLECKVFFIPNKHAPWQKFCNQSCKDNYNKRNKPI